MRFKSFEELVDHCRGLRAESERSEARFFLALLDVERQHMAFLSLNGYTTFAQFLKNYTLCDPSRYSRFAAGVAFLAKPVLALKLGVPAVAALSGIRNKDTVPEYVQAVEAFIELHGGTMPSGQRSQELLRMVDPIKRIPRAVTQKSELGRLRAQVQELQTKLRAAETEAERWKKEAQSKTKEVERLKNRHAGLRV